MTEKTRDPEIVGQQHVWLQGIELLAGHSDLLLRPCGNQQSRIGGIQRSMILNTIHGA